MTFQFEDLVKFFGVFLGSFLLDIIWVFTVRRTAQGKYLQSAAFSSLTTLVGGLVVIEYVGSKWLLVPAVLGSFIGNYLTVKWDLVKPKSKF